MIVNARVLLVKPAKSGLRLTIEVPHAMAGAANAMVTADYHIGLCGGAAAAKPAPEPTPPTPPPPLFLTEHGDHVFPPPPQKRGSPFGGP